MQLIEVMEKSLPLSPEANAEIAHDRLMNGSYADPYLERTNRDALLNVAKRHRTERTEQVRLALRDLGMRDLAEKRHHAA